jgi:glycosyltransferase involved in cell wall biosynthesis
MRGSSRAIPARLRARVVQVITRLELGGAQQCTLHLAEHLGEHGFGVTLVTGVPDQLDADAQGIAGLDFMRVASLRREIGPVADASALAGLARALRSVAVAAGGPVLVHTHGSKAGILGRWAARLAGIPHVVHTYHGFGFHRYQPAPLRAALIAAERLTRPLTSAFVCVSRANLEAGRALGVLDARRTVLIRSGFDIETFRREAGDPAAFRREIGVGADAPLVGSVACLKPQKAPVDFVRMAAAVVTRVPAARFVMVGDGVLRPRVEQAIREARLDGRVHLTGWRRDVPRILAALDVLAHGGRWEGLPRVLPQALSLGVPVVAMAVDGVPEAVSDGRTGFLVPPGDTPALADRVVAVLRDAALRARLGAAGRDAVMEFDARPMLARHVELYEALLSGQWSDASRRRSDTRRPSPDAPTDRPAASPASSAVWRPVATT